MLIEENMTGGLKIVLSQNENSGMLPEELKYILGRGVQVGSTKIRSITIEYVTKSNKHYTVTQYDEVKQ